MNSSVSSHLRVEVDYDIITDKLIDPADMLRRAHAPGTGGIVLFSGEVRNHHKGREVDYLEYEAYIPMAEKMIRELLATAMEKWQLSYASCVHRIGRVNISESAIVVVTAHSHRIQAFEANQFIIDKVKTEVPIWKKEFFTDGSAAYQ